MNRLVCWTKSAIFFSLMYYCFQRISLWNLSILMRLERNFSLTGMNLTVYYRAMLQKGCRYKMRYVYPWILLKLWIRSCLRLLTNLNSSKIIHHRCVALWNFCIKLSEFSDISPSKYLRSFTLHFANAQITVEGQSHLHPRKSSKFQFQSCIVQPSLVWGLSNLESAWFLYVLPWKSSNLDKSVCLKKD